ncbi:MAG: LamG domain-containing protein [Candidatus Peribacteraceae bacterium]|nr:LamG domain-containing protein [Candidatus Peribacteraceae bacterium]
MKKLLFIILFLFCLHASVFAQVKVIEIEEPINLTSQLDLVNPLSNDLQFAWYGKVGQTTSIVDLSQYHNYGIINGATWQGKSLYFDGTDDNIALNGTASGNLDIIGTGITLIVKIRFDTNNLTVNYIDKRGGANADSYRLLRSANNLRFRLTTSLGTTNHQTSVLAPDIWYVTAATYDGAFMRNYIDGLLDGSPTARTGTITSSALDVAIGSTAEDQTNAEHLGHIEYVLIYDRALNASEIKQLYRDPTAPFITKRDLFVTVEEAIDGTIYNIFNSILQGGVIR